MISNKQFIVFESNLPNAGDLEYCTKHPSFLCADLQWGEKGSGGFCLSTPKRNIWLFTL